MPDNLQKYYYPQLDAIRGLSFLAVFFFHAWHPDFGNGFLNEMLQFFYGCLDFSIDVFFVLSSFLLTWLGINESERNGNFSFKKYFLRRALRIWPLYYVLMLFSFSAVPLAAAYFNTPITLPPPAWYLFFLSNFYTKGHVYFLRFLWTLSVEEQFYLALGVGMFLFQRHLKLIALIFLAISIVFNFYAAAESINSYFNTLTYLFDFAAGMLAALALKRNGFLIQKLRAMTPAGSIIFYCLIPFMLLAGFLCHKYSAGSTQNIVLLITRLAFILFIAVFIIEQTVSAVSPLQLHKTRLLIYTGKISYGLYCFHGIILTFGAVAFTKMKMEFSPLLTAFIFLFLNYAVASGSYFLLEKPFLRLKDRLRRI